MKHFSITIDSHIQFMTQTIYEGYLKGNQFKIVQLYKYVTDIMTGIYNHIYNL